MTHTTYQVANENIVFEEFDNDLVVLNLSTGQYFGLNGSASLAWKALVSGVAPQGLAGLGALNSTLDGFVETLKEMGLIVAVEATGKSLDPVLEMALAACSEAPTIETFDDLSDLILADPIHDVEAEAGWPKMPGTA